MSKKPNALDRFKKTMTAIAMGAASLVSPGVVSSGRRSEDAPLPETSKDTLEEDMKEIFRQAEEDVALSFRRDEEMVYRAYGLTHKGSTKIKYYKDENGNVVAGSPETVLEEIKPLTNKELERVAYLKGSELHFSRDPNSDPIELDFDGVKVENGEVVNNIVVKRNK